MEAKEKEILDIYSDYIISSFWQITATGLSSMLDWTIKHDKITNFLSNRNFESKDLWSLVKPEVRKIENENWVLAFDDSIEEKQYTDENDIICWHWDHTFWRNVKWINLMQMLYVWEELSIPIWYEIVKKTTKFIDKKTGKEKRKSDKNKNEIFREMLDKAISNILKFKYITMDSWFCNKKNLQEIIKLWKHFITETPKNRLVSLSYKDKLEWKNQRVDSLGMNNWDILKIYIEWLEIEILLIKQVFTNKDNSIWERYLLCSDTTLDFDSITKIYKKRWKIEESFKSMKSNTWFGKSPTHTVRTIWNHLFSSIYSCFKLQLISVSAWLNSFALKQKLYIKALQSAFTELSKFKLSLS